MGYVDGLLSAALFPAVLTIGFFFWERAWKGSALVLNAVKGCLSSLMFFAVVLAAAGASRQPVWPDIGGTAVFMLWLSGFLGIVLGDTFWLIALERLGAHRCILVDSTKPFLSAAVAALALGEAPKWQVFVGMGIVTSGVLVVALEPAREPAAGEEAKGEEAKGEQAAGAEPAVVPEAVVLEVVSEEAPVEVPPATSTKATAGGWRQWPLATGFASAATNCAFDVAGAVIVKRYAGDYATWHINCLRFGTAGLQLAALLLAAQALSALGKAPPPAWARWPDLTGRAWAMMVVGITFATFFAPAMAQYALFEIDLAVYMTLISMGPIWALPVGFGVKRVKPSLRALLGSVLAVAGVVPLALSEAGKDTGG